MREEESLKMEQQSEMKELETIQVTINTLVMIIHGIVTE